MKLLIADDSAFMRSALSGMFRELPGWEVHVARDGGEALAKARELRPDVVTLDINMPVMDGLTCLAHIMTECPCPVVMISSLTQKGATVTLEALSMGAVDYIPKPDGTVSLNILQLRGEVVARVRAAAQARVRPAASRPAAGRPARRRSGAPPAGPAGAGPPGLVLLGCSTGGPQALEDILPRIPADFPWAVLIAQHIPATFTGSLARRLDGVCQLRVCEVSRMIALESGAIYLARGDCDLLISGRAGSTLAMPVPSDSRYLWHPSVERMVRSALEHLPPSRLIGVQLTGMGHDGADAMSDLRRRGGHTVAESRETAVIYGMPGALVERGGAELVLPLHQIPAQIQHWIGFNGGK